MAARRRGRLHDLSDLKSIGVNASRPAAFITLDGRRPPYQPRLL
jgi:hypothetical protein